MVATTQQDEHVQLYGAAAAELVSRCYQRLTEEFMHMKAIGRIPRGAILSEVVASSDNALLHDLMSAKELASFQAVSAQYTIEQFMRAVWYILENVCLETSLRPAITVSRATGDVCVRLVP